jgi:hypothetical protein
VSQERLNALYDTCAAVVLVSDYEGFGLPVAEAARRGVRSLVSPQVARVQQDLTPYLVTVAQSPDALHNALRQMVQQPVRLDPHVGAGAARYLHLYRGLLGAQA